MQILHNPLYAGAYAFGRGGQRTRILDRTSDLDEAQGIDPGL